MGEAVGPHLPLLMGQDAKFAAGHRAAEKDEDGSLVFGEIRVGMAGCQETIGKASYCAVLGSKEAANVVSEPSIPFLPAVADKTADLI